jgi:uncharacterized protein YjbJ (UPF0337 family)
MDSVDKRWVAFAQARVFDDRHSEHALEEGVPLMDGKIDDLKGRAKEAAGDLTDNDRMKNDGKVDQASGKIKDKLENAKDWVEDKVDKARDKSRS